MRVGARKAETEAEAEAGKWRLSIVGLENILG